jgi:hypothetical protein
MCFFRRLCFAVSIVVVPDAAFPQRIDRPSIGAPTTTSPSKGDAALVVSRFEEALHRDLKALIYAAHARMSRETGELDRAIVECTEAIRLNPAMLDAYSTRARAWMAKADFDIATAAVLKQPAWVRSAASPPRGSSRNIDLLVGDPATGRPTVPAVLERSHPAGKLDLRNVAFCDKIENYGRWTRFKHDEFKAGTPVLLYADVDNFASVRTTGKVWLTLIQSRIEIFDETGTGILVCSMPFPPTEDLCQNVRRDYYNSYEFTIPSPCTPGPHTLKLTVEDLLSAQKASYTVNFAVK